MNGESWGRGRSWLLEVQPAHWPWQEVESGSWEPLPAQGLSLIPAKSAHALFLPLKRLSTSRR